MQREPNKEQIQAHLKGANLRVFFWMLAVSGVLNAEESI
jgi:hypothetical protein